MSKPFPTPTDAAYIKRLRKDYPETCDGHDDEWVMNRYNYGLRMQADIEVWGEWGTSEGGHPQDAPTQRGCPCTWCTTYWLIFDGCQLRMPYSPPQHDGDR